MIRHQNSSGTLGSWARFWMRFSGLCWKGRLATRIACWGAPLHYSRVALARIGPNGFISPAAEIQHPGFRQTGQVILDDRVLIYHDRDGGPVTLEHDVHLWRDTIIQTGLGGSVHISAGTHVQPRCQFSAYISEIRIGKKVEIAPGCSFYSYDHGVEPDQPINRQPLTSKGPITIEDEAWLGVGAVVLSGVRIGTGAVIGAGAVVIQDIPAGAIAVGSPARVVKFRDKLAVVHPRSQS